MKWLLSIALSGIGLYLAHGHEAFWPLAWLAPIPIIRLAFEERRPRLTFLSALAAHGLGGIYLVETYADVLPWPALGVALMVPALCFGLAISGTALAARRLGEWTSPLAFAILATGSDYLLSFGPDGAALSPAYSQVAFPPLVQTSALVGIWGVTFVLSFVAAALALALATRRPVFVVAAAAVFATNLGFGLWRIGNATTAPGIPVGLIANDQLNHASFDEADATARSVVDSYTISTRELIARGAKIVVWPEKIAILLAARRDEVLAQLQTTADETAATLIVGFDERAVERLNRVYVFQPNHKAPAGYDKRHLVPGLERAFTPGRRHLQFAPTMGVAICKDMDFPATVRGDALAAPIAAMFVPAWDFDHDAWLHARIAIMRGIENGFSVARTAKQGLLTLTDAYGRQIARAQSDRRKTVSLVAALPPGPGATLYTRIGDLLALACTGLAALGMIAAWAGNEKRAATRAG